MSTGPTGPTGPDGNGIQYSYIDQCGNLIFVYDNNYVDNAGPIPTATGPTGPIGTTGPTGPSGVGIDYISMNNCNQIVITLSNGTRITLDISSLTQDVVVPMLYYYGTENPTTAGWPPNTTPTPTKDPKIGNVYINIRNGYFFVFSDSQNWITSSI